MKLTYRAVAVALSLLAVVGCGEQDDKKSAESAKQAQKMPPASVGVIEVQLGALPIVAEASGRTVAVEVSEVRPQISGIVEEILFQEGSPVKAGQPLYRINPDNYSSTMAMNEASLHQAEASIATAQASVMSQQALLEQAEVNLERYKALLEIDAVSHQAYEQAVTNARTAKAGLEQARANLAGAEAGVLSAKARIGASQLDLERTIVRSPISGKSGISSVTKGALVSAGQPTPLVKISRFDPMFVDISQASADILKLRESFRNGTAGRGNLEVELVLSDGSVYPIKGQLILDNGQVNETTGAITLRAVFDNPDGGLLPGMFVNARINQSVVENATLIPQSALIRTPKGDTQVYVVQDGKIAVRDVALAGTFAGQWVVTSGLQTGDKLVVMGGGKVKPDQAVEAKVLPPTGGQAGESEPATPVPTPLKAGENSVLKPKTELTKPAVVQREAGESSDTPSDPASKTNATADDKSNQTDDKKPDNAKSDNAKPDNGKADNGKSDNKADSTKSENAKRAVGSDSPVDGDLEKQMLEMADEDEAK